MPADTNTNIEELIKTFQELNNKQEFEKLIESYTIKYVSAQGNHELTCELARAFAGRAESKLNEGDFGMASRDLERAIKLNPKCAEYHFEWAHVMRGFEENDNAIKGFTKAIEIDPLQARYHYCRGAMYRRAKKYDEAIADLTKAIELDPKHFNAYIERGGCWYEKKDYDRSISDLTMSIEIEPGISTTWHNRGAAWYDKKEYDKGIKDLSQAILLKPGFASSYLERGLNYEGKKKYNKAIADYTKAMELDPTWSSPYVQRAEMWKQKNELGKAIIDYDSLLRILPKFDGAHFKRGLLWFELEEYKEALNNFERALELKPGDKEVSKWLSKAKANLQKSPETSLPWQPVRDQAASFIEQLVKDYGERFKGHEDGFVFGVEIRKWDDEKGCPAWAGITGWLPAFRPDLAKWCDFKERFGLGGKHVLTHKDTEFNPEDAGVPISEELWKAITGTGWLSKYGEKEIGQVRKFEKVAPMLMRIAARIRLGDLDDELIFEYE